MPGLHPDVRLCRGPCDRICPENVLSRCDFCGADVCDDCKEYLVWSDDLLCPSCLESEMRAHLAFAPRRELR
jgi:hypothetical protein